MSSVETKPAFLERFDSVWSKMRMTQIGQAVCWGLLARVLSQLEPVRRDDVVLDHSQKITGRTRS